METVFLSYHFADRTTPLFQNVVRVLEGLGLRVVMGTTLGGGPLSQSIKDLIEGSDCVLSLMTDIVGTEVAGTEAEKAEKQKWVRDEYGHAKSKELPAIAMLEEGLAMGGGYGNDEYIPLDRGDQLAAMIRLVETVGFWRDKFGSRLTVRVDPQDIAGSAARNELSQCRYREYVRGKYEDWEPTQLIKKPGGVFTELPHVRPASLIEIDVKSPSGHWTSATTPQYCHVELAEGAHS